MLLRTSSRLSSDFIGVIAREVGKFGVVGVLALIVDVGGFNLLRFAGGEGPLYDWPLAAKVLSATAATIVSWIGNRLWTFRQYRRPQVHREFLLFVIACALGTLLSLICLAISHYVLGLQSALADNISANVIGLVLGTTFRFWAYRTFVFNSGRGRRSRGGLQGETGQAHDPLASEALRVS